MTDPLTIEVRGLAVHAHHGVHAHERENGQRFVLDLALVPRSDAGVRDRSAGRHGVLRRCGALAVENNATSTRFDLIERLAPYRGRNLARIPLERATVTVHKPDAPLGLDFEDVAVTVSRRQSAVGSYLKGQAGRAVL